MSEEETHQEENTMNLGTSLLSLGCAMIGATMVPALPAIAQADKPNIVFILEDNVGWGDFGVYGGTIPTPRIDVLAREGIRAATPRGGCRTIRVSTNGGVS